MNDPREYNICVRFRRDEDGDSFVATIKELPDVAVYEDTFQEAYDSALGVVADLQEVFEEKRQGFSDAPARVG